MKNLFIPYKQASELKELGFDEPCIGYYTKTTEKLCRVGSSKYNVDFETVTLKDIYHDYCLAPTFSQVLEWFRSKHDLHTYIKKDKWNHWQNTYILINKEWEKIDSYESYEQAELSCIKELIGLIKK